MKNQTGSDKVRERALSTFLSGVCKMRKEPAVDLDARSKPLTSHYNSTFVVLVLAIAAILAVILLIWA
ncbi:MAG: hypothetical protein HYY23_16220 [Verrucomicrobia bacterium]|nr:hypothetical protein [Verrucomicrobiota bacterium]